MEFNAIGKETVFLNPKKDMEKKSIKSEIRFDPLTGRTARICHFMKLAWEKPDFDSMVKSVSFCPFCPQTIFEVTPCFENSLIPEGRAVKDDMVIVPNIAPYDSLGAVLVMTDRHYIPMTEITSRKITDAFMFAKHFFERVEAAGHSEAVYHIVNWNYMPPSGSSIIHPHLQVFSTSTPPNLMREALTASEAYAEANKSLYWDDFTEKEKNEGKRYLGAVGNTQWFVSYAPLGVAGDVMAVVDNKTNTMDLTEDDFMNLADGLTRLMAAYDKMGIYSFNMNFFTGKKGDDHFRFFIIFSPRTYFNQKLGTPDAGALRHLFNESVCMAYPEEIAEMLKPYF